MRLTVKRHPSGSPAGHSYLLCDEKGEPLPHQLEVVIAQTPEAATITVTFAIDGDEITLA